MLAVNAAGAGYSINQYIAPAHKMQIISDKYNEAFMDNLYQSIKNITPDQFRECSNPDKNFRRYQYKDRRNIICYS
jgi:hypothetical protein